MLQPRHRSDSRARRLAAFVAIAIASAGAAGAAGAAGVAVAGEQPATTPDSSAGPVTIEHAFGATVVDAVPQRVVALDDPWLDTLIALDVPTVGHQMLPPGVETDSGHWAWQDGISPASLGIAGDYVNLPYESIAALEPDLIVGTWVISTPEVYDALSAIAPTIGPIEAKAVQDWDTLVRVGGEVFDKHEAATAAIAELDDRIGKVAADHPNLAGKTFVLVNYYESDLVIVSDPDDGANKLFAQLGLQLPSALAEFDDQGQGRITVSVERVDLLESDVLGFFSLTGDPTALPGFDQLTAVETGAWVELDYEQVLGLNTPSVLALPYALDAFAPALDAAEAAAAG